MRYVQEHPHAIQHDANSGICLQVPVAFLVDSPTFPSSGDLGPPTLSPTSPAVDVGEETGLGCAPPTPCSGG
eukprot:11823861-Prorocentrum_lima.AAC.1